jgi:hypothetical protein
MQCGSRRSVVRCGKTPDSIAIFSAAFVPGFRLPEQRVIAVTLFRSNFRQSDGGRENFFTGFPNMRVNILFLPCAALYGALAGEIL